MSEVAPLTSRAAYEHIGFALQSLPAFAVDKGPITRSQFLSHVQALAAKLPAHATVINLCANRYYLLVAFCAALVRKQTNLLPPNHKLETQKKLQQRYPDSYIVHDGVDVINNLPLLDLSSMCLQVEPESGERVPQIALSHLAAISFTSGSTGDSKPNNKTWLTIVESSRINRRHMLPDNTETLYQLATVPAQHMWGLETSALLPLFANVCLSDIKPLFPLDIKDGLVALPAPRMMVSTPVHLRAMCASDIAYESVKLLLCATSPLSQELARACEETFSAELREVYGCSEIGSMALRKTASTDVWQRFSEIKFSSDKAGQVYASTDYLPDAIALQDNIEIIQDREFRLAGRLSDMVNIAGKRGSLHEINQVLLAYDGVVDGVVFQPKRQPKQNIARLAALVVLKPGCDIGSLRHYLADHLDNAFIPRPIRQVDRLPREPNGKLPYRQLIEFYASLAGA